MDFSVDKENRTIKVEREFASNLDNVWAAWTQRELLDQWWAPKPWKAETKSMDFSVGGQWLYAMVSPEGDKHWSIADYKAIETKRSFSGLDAFTDENGTVNEEMPRSMWNVSFSDKGDSTLVNIQIKYDELKDLEATINMGFKEGFTAGMENLDELLAKK